MPSYFFFLILGLGVTSSFAQFENLSVGEYNLGKCDTLCTDQNLKQHLGAICVQIGYLYRNEIQDLYDEKTVKTKSECEEKMPLELLNNVGGAPYTYSRIVGRCHLSDEVSYCVIKYPYSMRFVHVYSFINGECRKGWKKKYDFSAALPPEKPVLETEKFPRSDSQKSISPVLSSFPHAKAPSFRGKNDARSESTDTTPSLSSFRPLAPSIQLDETESVTSAGRLPRSSSSMPPESTSFKEKSDAVFKSENIRPTSSSPSSSTHAGLPVDRNSITSSDKTTQPLSSSHPSDSSTKQAKCGTCAHCAETMQHSSSSLHSADAPSKKKCALSCWSCCIQWIKSLFCKSG